MTCFFHVLFLILANLDSPLTAREGWRQRGCVFTATLLSPHRNEVQGNSKASKITELVISHARIGPGTVTVLAPTHPVGNVPPPHCSRSCVHQGRAEPGGAPGGAQGAPQETGCSGPLSRHSWARKSFSQSFPLALLNSSFTIQLSISQGTEAVTP